MNTASSFTHRRGVLHDTHRPQSCTCGGAPCQREPELLSFKLFSDEFEEAAQAFKNGDPK
eukprot:SAG22_NODE_583_length_8878_cov_47.533546_6_plen_60_part_00